MLFSVDGNKFDQHEEYRLARVTAIEATSMIIDATEARYGHRWWTMADLATTNGTVSPADMAALLPAVLAGVGSHPLHLGDFDVDLD